MCAIFVRQICLVYARRRSKQRLYSGVLQAYFVFVCIISHPNEIRGSVFQEEYVIPQILTEDLRELGFDGIAYSSSQLLKSFCYSEEDIYTNKYRENLVLLTRYSGTEPHDSELIDKFQVSRPVRHSEIPKISMDDVQDLGSQIIAMYNSRGGGYGTLTNLASRSGIHFKTHFEKVKVLSKDKTMVSYSDHPLGEVHLYLLYQYMIGVRNSITGSP
jgi:hypothetical protein